METKRIVKMYKMKPDQSGQEVIAELYMNEDLDVIEGGAVTPQGQYVLDNLEVGNITVNNEKLSFLDKEKYLRSLHLFYDSPYLSASTYKAQPSEIDLIP
jgi:hypothetical protein